MGVVAGVYDYDWKEAERCFRLALAHDPVPPRVRQWYGYFYLLPMGQLEEAVEQQEQGLKEDPLNFVACITLAESLVSVGRLAEAEAHKVLEFEENQPWALWNLALTNITLLSSIEENSLKFRVTTRTATYQAHQPRLNRP